MGIKEKIIKKVKTIDNPEILNNILNLISSEVEIDEIYQFSDAEKKLVQEGIIDADNGNVFTQEESDQIISKWLEERSGGRTGL